MYMQIKVDEMYNPILVERIEKEDILSVLQSTKPNHTTYVLIVADSDFNLYNEMDSETLETALESDDSSIAKFHNI